MFGCYNLVLVNLCISHDAFSSTHHKETGIVFEKGYRLGSTWVSVTA